MPFISLLVGPPHVFNSLPFLNIAKLMARWLWNPTTSIMSSCHCPFGDPHRFRALRGVSLAFGIRFPFFARASSFSNAVGDSLGIGHVPNRSELHRVVKPPKRFGSLGRMCDHQKQRQTADRHKSKPGICRKNHSSQQFQKGGFSASHWVDLGGQRF